MIVVGASGEPLAVSPGQLIGGNRSIQAHRHLDGSQDSLAFSALTGVAGADRSSRRPRPTIA
jgi:hypothetical protein